FAYNGTGPGVDATVTLDDYRTNTDTGSDLDCTLDVSAPDAGKDYSVSEDGEIGFDLHDLTCTGLETGDTSTKPTVSITSLEPGRSEERRVGKEWRGPMTITKESRTNDPQEFSYPATGPGLEA